jgi:hypothetical protein
MRRLSIGVVTLSLIAHAPAAWASTGQEDPATPATEDGGSSQGFFTHYANGGDEPSVSVAYEQVVALGGGGAGRGVAAVRPRECELWEAPGGPGSMGTENRPLAAVAGDLVEGAWYYQTCRYLDTGELASSRYWQYQAGGLAGSGPDLAALAASAYDRIPLPFPVPSTAPALAAGPITGLETWLWIDPAGWQVREATASLAGFSVTVTATPTRVVWDMGEGQAAVVCEGPGVVWQPNGGEDQETDCSYNYRWNSGDEPDGTFQASVTVVWDVAWRASNGATGDLAAGQRTTTFDVAVRSIEASICYRDVCPEDGVA